MLVFRSEVLLVYDCKERNLKYFFWLNLMVIRSFKGVSAADRVKSRRAQFVQAGIALFGTRGFRVTTVKDLCNEAKLTDRYFYESFESLEDLLAVIYTEVMSGIEQDFLALLADSEIPNHEKSKQLLTRFFSVFEDPRIAKLSLFEVLGVSPRMDSLYQQNNLRFCNFLSLAVTRLYGNFKGKSTELYICMGLIGALSQMAIFWHLGNYRDPVSKLVDSALILIEGSTAGSIRIK